LAEMSLPAGITTFQGARRHRFEQTKHSTD
jgi:hypothetical protein